MQNKVIMVYGCYGYTGMLVVEELLERGARPILAGRNKAKIDALATRFQLESRVFDMDDKQAIRSVLVDVDVMMNCGGPFGYPITEAIEACIDAHCHYLDIGGELELLKYAKQRHDAAEARGLVLVPAAGIDVVPTE